MTLRCHFLLKSAFCAGLSRFFCLDFSGNYMETNENTAILLATKMFVIDYSFC